MAKRSTREQGSGQAMIYNFLLNEVLASQAGEGHRLWLVAPWVSDFPLEGPYHVSFDELVDIRQDTLRLFDVLHQIAANGGQVRIAVGSDAQYHAPLRALARRDERITVHTYMPLHAKAYVGRFGALAGSLNLTGRGVHHNAELYDYYHDEKGIAEVRQFCSDIFDAGVAL